MKFVWHWKFSRIVVLGAICVWFHVQSSSASTVTKKDLENPGVLDHLRKVIQDKELSTAESLKGKALLPKYARKTVPNNNNNAQNQNKKAVFKPPFKKETLRQDLLVESKDNCLAKLICDYPKPSTPTKGIFRDYASLIKGFLDIFADESPPTSTEKKENKNTKTKSEKVTAVDQEDDSAEDDARMGFVNITGSLVSDSQEVTTSAASTVSSVTTGATITELPSSYGYPGVLEEGQNTHKVTLEEFVGDAKLRKDLRARQSRALISSPEMSFGNLQQTNYINRKIREMHFTKSESRKLKIAGKIAAKLRQPKQCREFANVATEILTTCPLTSEVIRYFNTNLNNGSQQVAILELSPNATQGGLVVLNDQEGIPHPYFMDNSPIVANTKINTDLKNPSIERFPLEDIQMPIYANVFPGKKGNKGKQKKDSDEEESDENEEDDEDNEEEDEEENDDEEQDEENDQERKESANKPYKPRKNKPYRKLVVPKKDPKPPAFPKGMIKVYGIPQPSFDNEFSKISTQIGTGQVLLFDQDDYDAYEPHPGPKIEKPRARPTPTAASPRQQKTIKKSLKVAKNPKPPNSEEEEESTENEQQQEKQQNHQRQQQSFGHPPPPHAQARRPFNFATNHVYGGFPGPRREEYYHYEKPLRQPPPTPYAMPMIYKPRPEVRGRLNFANSPGAAGFMRPHQRSGQRPQHGFIRLH